MKTIIAIESEFAQEYYSKKINATQEELQLAFDKFDGKEQPSIYSEDGETANIMITGPLSRSGPDFWDMLMGYGGTSYNSIIEAIEKAEENQMIRKIQFQMDTPGGEVAGVDEVFQSIAGCKKKTIAINNGMIASAGYWIASSCDKILATESTSETGSIGVVISAQDWSEAYKKFGIKIYDITSENAENKRPDISTKKGRDVLKDRVDAIENVFIQRIATGRKTTTDDVKKNYGRGALLIAENPNGTDAIKVGMIDGMIKSESIGYNDVGGYDPGITGNVHDIGENNTTPTGENTEETRMTLEEFLAQNPDAKAKHDVMIKAAEDRGAEAKQKEMQARINSTVNYIGNENYPGEAIQNQAIKVLKGESSPDSLEGAIVAYDMMVESAKSSQAIIETKQDGETPAGDEPSKEKTENIQAQEDLKKAARYA